MTETWLLPGAVLLVGLVSGLLVSRRLRRGAREEDRSDRALRLADLREQRDDIYAKLRGEDGELPEGEDRAALEELAARVLMELDQLGPADRARPRIGARQKSPAAPVAPSSPPTRGSWTDRHPLLAGTFLGGGLVALVAVLLFWAQRDARPDAQANQGFGPPTAQSGAQSGPPSSNPAGSGSGGPGLDRGEPPLPPEILEQVQALRERLIETPNDLSLRRDLTQLLLAHGQFFDAFGEAQAILAQESEDPLATYVVGIVRYTMGQPEDALSWLERSIRSDPTFSQASLVRGILLLQLGDREAAIESWQNGLDAVGGSEPRLERLLEQARAGKSADEILQSPG